MLAEMGATIKKVWPAALCAVVCACTCACTVENPGYSPDGRPGDGAAPAGDLMTKVDIKTCTPNAALGCKGSTTLLRCNAAGTGTRTESCPYGCNAKARRCNQCNPAWPPRCSGATLYTCTKDGDIKYVKCPDACKDGKCVSTCTKKVFYLDKDKDGYGDGGKPTAACDVPAGYSTNTMDCDDGNKDVRPGQSKFFDKPIPGTKGFDYNCDGQQEPRYPKKAKCKKQGKKCVGSGWGLFVPSCGNTGMWLECVKYGSHCGEKIGARSQACR